jgi:transmembrane sensor
MTENKNNIDSKLLRKFLEGKASDEDIKSIKQWLSTSNPDHDLYEESNNFWGEIPLDMNIDGYNGSQILDRIHHLIRIEESTVSNNSRTKTRFITWLTRIAAILFIPLLVASLLLYNQFNSAETKESSAEIYAPSGTRTNFILPDGTTGKLNGGSSLKFPVQFRGKTRVVELKGEAYFDVITDQKKPFVVSTENIDVKVSGTSFNVLAYPDEFLAEVILREGEIEVFSKRNDKIRSMGILKPDESYIYDFQSDSGNILSVSSSQKLSWLEGKLTFKYEPFSEVIRKINRWYNVNIVIKDELLDTYLYYGTFQDETIDEVLKLLQLTAPIKYRDLSRQKDPDGTFMKRKIEVYSKNN